MNIVTLGIDMASRPKTTAACMITWEAGRAVASPSLVNCDDENLDELISCADAVGIDAPFGWPAEFTKAVTAWDFTSWDDNLRKQLCFRVTDIMAQETLGNWPLSVSTDRIALPAMRTFSLLQRHGVDDRSGDGKFYEVYPAGSLRKWGLPYRNYKKDTSEHQQIRQQILNGLREALPWLAIPDECVTSSHALDALVASLTVRAAMQNRTSLPSLEQIALAEKEGWIHLPTGFPLCGR